jgi:HlyD family secretion protein
MELSSMDQAIPWAKRLKRNLKVSAYVLTVISALTFAFFGFRNMITPQLTEGEYETSTVSYGVMLETISSSGKIELDHHFIILSPATTILESIKVSPGQLVEIGDTLLFLDQDPIQKKYNELSIQLKSLKNKKLKNRLNTQNEGIDLEFKLKKILIDISKYEAQYLDQKNLLEVGGTSKAKVREAEQALSLTKYEYVIASQKNKIRVQEFKAIETDLEIEYQMKRTELQATKNQLARMVVTAPTHGVVISIATETGKMITKDTELVKISDLNTFKITGKIADSFADKISSGGKVEIIIDKDTRLTGTIGNIRPLVENGQVYFDVFPETKKHPKFRPNMEVELRILTAFKQRTLKLKDGPFFDGSKKLKVYKVTGQKAIATDIITGMKNIDYVEIVTGINEGDKVVISDVSAISHLTEVEIKPKGKDD